MAFGGGGWDVRAEGKAVGDVERGCCGEQATAVAVTPTRTWFWARSCASSAAAAAAAGHTLRGHGRLDGATRWTRRALRWG